jgi:hypothetical protein
MKKIIVTLVVLLLVGCTSQYSEREASYPQTDYSHLNGNVYYSLLSLDSDVAMYEYYKNDEYIFDVNRDIYEEAATVVSNGELLGQFQKDSGSNLVSEDPSQNMIEIVSKNTSDHTTYWRGNDNDMTLIYNGLPVYKHCLEASFSSETNSNECDYIQIKYGHEVLYESHVKLDVQGIWEETLVFSDWDDVVYVVDLSAEDYLVDVLSEGGYGFSYLIDGEPIFYDGIHVAWSGGANVYSTSGLFNSVIAEGVSLGSEYFIQLDPFTDYSDIVEVMDSGSKSYNLIRDGIKLISFGAYSGTSWDIDFEEMERERCLYEMSSFSIYSDNNPCIWGENYSYVDVTSENKTILVVNGMEVEFPEKWYIPSIKSGYEFDYDYYSPSYEVTDCYESKDCLILKEVAPIFQESPNSFQLIASAKSALSYYDSDLYLLNYEMGQLISVELLKSDINQFYGTSM